MHKSMGQKYGNGFALPTILISSIVMLIVLLASVSSTTAVRVAIQNQYYAQLAQAAGDAGVAYAEACLAASGGVPGWSNSAPLQPNTDCSGTPLVSCPTTSNNPLCWVTKNENVISSFSIARPSVDQPSVLVVGGGGSGGGSTGGGGGAGGVVYVPSMSLDKEAYTVVVGDGGAATGIQSPGQNGGNSSFNGIVAFGGGGGGYSTPSPSGGPGQNGGSGGGGQNYYGSTYVSGSGTPGQGNDGGPLGTSAGSGGGGAGGPGFAGSGSSVGGNGGVGIANSITGTSVFYGGGGGGGNGGTGGNGGGGNGANVGASGVANTGGGGGGGWAHASGNGGAGGSGVVIIRYPTGSITASGGALSTSGGYTIRKFTSGSSTFNVTAVSNLVQTIPNSGFVQILRSSNSAVWKTYNQTSTPPSVVPDLCSGSAKSIYGWNNAVVRNASYSISDSTAQAIGIGPSATVPGDKYFRKDFSVTKAGTYTLKLAGNDYLHWYVDGDILSNWHSTAEHLRTKFLDVGCHTMTIRATNTGILPSNSDLMGSLTLNGSSFPIVVTDSSWRVSAGGLVHYSSPNYYVDPSAWTNATEVRPSTSGNSSWTSVSGDSDAYFITSPANSGSYSPGSQWTNYRDANDVIVPSNTSVRVTAQCDDKCVVYMDGNAILPNVVWSTNYTTTLTMTAGTHHFGVASYNGGSAAGASGFSFAAVRLSDGATLSRSSASWLGANYWNPTDQNPYSYDTSFASTPVSAASATGSVLVVGGGGSGGSSASGKGGAGGGGAGGLLYNTGYSFRTGDTIPVTVGGGGASVSGTSIIGNRGADSVFGSMTAIGGGGGSSAYPVTGATGGGSGGGGGYNGYSVVVLGSAGIINQGNSGGKSNKNNNGGGGGGAGGNGGDTDPAYVGVAGGVGGVGGVGLSNSISGSAVTYARGGDGASNPVQSGAANTGNGGSAGPYSSTAASGAGGSGIVIISYPTGSMTTTGGTVTYSGGNTIVTFTSSGTFTVTSVT